MNDLKTLYNKIIGREIPMSIEMKKELYDEYKHFPYTEENPKEESNSENESDNEHDPATEHTA